MSTVDKNAAMVEFLLNCPTVQSSPLFFNFIDAKDDTTQVITEYDDVELQQPYIDGSVLKRYTFSVVCYKSISFNQVVKLPGYSDENMQNLAEVQDIMDWIDEQADSQNYPDFGPNCLIDEMENLTADPTVEMIDTKSDPPLASYLVGVRITYLDTTKCNHK